MAHPADSLPKCNFDGIPMPMLNLSITGEQAIEIHRYRFIAGGKLEVHKRSLWNVQVEATFQLGHFVAGFGAPMWPDALNALRDYFQVGHVGLLTVPHIGKLYCICKEWQESIIGSSITGANVTARFVEHGTTSFAQNELTEINAISFETSAAKFTKLVRDIPEPPGLFEQIITAANQILGIRDQFLLGFELIHARVLSLLDLFQEADRTLSLFEDPDNYTILDALKELWNATLDLVTRPEALVVQPRYYVVDVLSTVMEVAQRIYGNNNRARDLLELNEFDDAMRIPAGTRVLYIPDSV